RELATDPVETGDTAARLDRYHVDARDVDVFGDYDVGAVDRGLCRRAIAHFPVPNVVRLLLLVGPDKGRVGLESFERIDDRLERLVFDLDQGDGIGGGVARLGQHHGHFLRLVHDVIG